MTRRLLIIADDAFTAESLRRCLRGATNCTVLGFLATRRPCGLAVQQACPDLALVDDPTGSADVLERVREIRASLDGVKVILLAGDVSPTQLAAAEAAGAHAVISRTVQASSLGVLLREIAAGTVYHAFGDLRREVPETRVDGLTGRELEVLRLVAAGMPNVAIARQLWVTEQTVKFHLSNVYRKLGVANRTQASHYAHTRGLVDISSRPGPDQRPLTNAAVAA
jgi:DNA-binding NarL/FixJ family response regulator